MEEIIVDQKGVAHLLDGLNVHKAPSPDGLDARTLKESGSQISPFQAAVPQIKAIVSHYNGTEGLLVRHLSTQGEVEPTKSLSVVSEGKDNSYRERYIPLTRKSVIRFLIGQERFFNDGEKKKFEAFALALDSAIVNKYHGVLQDLKTLFDPINPDKDTVQTRKWTPREREDSEFWLLQRLDEIMERANFHELPQSTVTKALEEHEAMEGVRVSVDSNRYDVLKFWALGKETPKLDKTWYKEIIWRYTGPPTPIEYYKRVVVAIRLKKDQKLILKSFKEIPVGALEMMLPNGKIKIRAIDKWIIASSVSVAAIGIITKIVMLLAHISKDITVAVSLIMIIIATRAWTMYKNKRNKYLAELSSTLYFKNIANNRGLLALLVDRAEDESFKEALLVYSFLLANRPWTAREMSSSEQKPSDLGGIPKKLVEGIIQEWLLEKTGTKVEVDASEAIKLLTGFGILSARGDKLHVLPIESAIRNLPQQAQSLVARAAESDISEGYDRDDFLESKDQFEKRESRTKEVGWE